MAVVGNVSKFAKVYWTLAFVVGTGLTIAVNGAHAKGAMAAPGTWTAVFVAMCPPFVFAVLTEGYFLVRRSVPERVQKIVKWSVGGLALSAFAVSYETSRLFVISEEGPLPSWTGWVIPGMVDILVAVSGYVLYVLNAHGDVNEGDVHIGSSVSEPAVQQKPSVRITSPAPVSKPSVVSAKIPPTSSTLQPPKPPLDTPRSAPTTTPIVPTKEVVKPTTTATKSVDKAAITTDLEPYMVASSWILENKMMSRKSEAEVALILKYIDSGMNSNDIRKELGGAPATYDKVRGAWMRWKMSRAANGEPEFGTAMPFGNAN